MDGLKIDGNQTKRFLCLVSLNELLKWPGFKKLGNMLFFVVAFFDGIVDRAFYENVFIQASSRLAAAVASILALPTVLAIK
jgi:hypothetical protein